MKLRSPLSFGFAALTLAAVAAGCAAPTQLTSSWADPAAAGHTYNKIVVVGVTPKTSGRRMYEDAFVHELQSRGVNAVSSYTISGDKLDKDQAAAKLQEIGADAVLVTRLVDKETVETYYPPTYSTYAAPSAYYGGWYGYYNMGYTYMSSPGYVAQDHVFKVETNLYNVAQDKLAWSGLTETTLSSYDAPEREIDPLIYTLVTDMEKHHIIPKKK